MHSIEQPDLFGNSPPAKYPTAPGAKGLTRETRASSRRAGDAVRVAANTWRGRVLAEFATRRDGTPDEIAEALGRRELWVRPRCSELLALGLIAPTGDKRVNPASGSAATVFGITAAGRQEAAR